MNLHAFLHEMAMIHASVRKVQKELDSVKTAIEAMVISPEEVLTEGRDDARETSGS